MDEAESSGFASSSRSIDKSRVWSVKPLRSLVPVFVSPPSDVPPSYLPGQGPPFVYSPPAGPFPPGYAPFYPFCLPPEHQQALERNARYATRASNQVHPSSFSYPLHSPIPTSAFRARAQRQHAAHPYDGYGESNGDKTDSGFVEDGFENPHDNMTNCMDADDLGRTGRQKSKPYKQVKGGVAVNLSAPAHEVNIDSVAVDFLSKLNSAVSDTFQRADGDRDSVSYILMTYDMLRRRITQVYDGDGATPRLAKRPDLRAGTLLLNKGIRTNIKKRVGPVPGVEVGDVFIYRMEMCLVGLHTQSMAGIDYMNLKVTQEEEPLAVSIVSSGGYEDNKEDGDTLIYSGQGGNIFNRRGDKQVKDQKLERGNLALEKSLRYGNEVRVIRGLKYDVAHPTRKVYVYDGLYKIQSSWSEKGKSGHNVFRYKLVRLPGQPEGFVLWRSIQQWKEGVVARAGCIMRDLTCGMENLPVCLVNDVDDEKEPVEFTYLPDLKYPRPMKSPNPCSSCHCPDGCQPGDSHHCPCIQKNEGYLPYTVLGVLMNHRSLITECGPACQCPLTCCNRVSQAGFKVQLEVFRTRDRRGWGLRSWDLIPCGGFICQYAGEVIENNDDLEQDGNYIFDATRSFEPSDSMPFDLYAAAADKMPFPLVISSRTVGNVARFMNHSCSPNVFWQPVLRGHSSNECTVHIAFFAMKNIPPMTELTRDYGKVQPGKEDYRKQKCLCGSVKCRGFFY
ncbi:hypothetical protein Dimus_029790 [Dionaea muscipula]